MNKSLAKAFGRSLRDLRSKSGFSQEDLALESSLDRSYVSMLERGVRQPTLTTISKLAIVLKVSLTDFIADVEKKAKN